MRSKMPLCGPLAVHLVSAAVLRLKPLFGKSVVCIQASTVKGFSHCRDLSVDLAGDGDPPSMVGGFETGERKDHGCQTMKSKMTLSKALAGVKKGGQSVHDRQFVHERP